MIELHGWMSKAHVLIGHNIDKFDIRKVTARFIKYGLEPLHKIQTIDTYKKHKQVADTEGNGLNNVSKYYGLGKKYETMKDIARRCLENDMNAWKEFKKYNIQDVIINEKLYLKERGWYKNAPKFNILYEKPKNCPRCFIDFEVGVVYIKKGFTYKPNGKYQDYLCKNCGHRMTGELIEKFKPFYK